MMKEKSPIAQWTEILRNTKDSLMTDFLIHAVMSGPSSVILTDKTGNIEYVNDKFSAMTGYEVSEAIGKNLSQLTSGISSRDLNEHIWNELKEGRYWSGDIEGIKKNGELYWEQATFSPIHNEEGEVHHFLKIANDISKRKGLETQLRATIDTLQTHKDQLTLTNTQLKEATEELQKSRLKLQQQSREDALTGLLNRRGLAIEMQRMKSMAERQSFRIGLLIIDIDKFKGINDNHGHAAGDYVLKECAGIFRSLLRKSDVIARYGGDEIVVVIPSADVHATRTTAERILTTVRKHDFSVDGNKIPVTVSIGATSEMPVEGKSLDNMLKMADHALYYTKRNSRNSVTMWLPDDKLMPGSEDIPPSGFSIQNKPFQSVFKALIAMLDAREKTTGAHSKRVTKMAVVMAQSLHLSPTQIELCEQGALLHDIGKIAVPDAILLKNGPLTQEERKIIEKHPQTGYDILMSNPEFKDIAETVLSHHERFDGSGYPRGLKGDDICMAARIFAVIDTYDAMRAPRPYSSPLSAEYVLEEIKRCSGTQFDPEIVDAFVRCHNQIDALITPELF